MVIRLNNLKEIGLFVEDLSRCDDSYVVMAHGDPHKRVSAHSVIGLTAMALETRGKMVLVNRTREGYFPDSLLRYAVV